MKKCALFSCLGLGDGLIALVLANNLRLNGYEVATFHPSLHRLQGWFPDLPLHPFPSLEELKGYERFFIIYEESPWMQEVLSYCLKERRKETKVLNPIATKNCDYPFWEEGKFQGDRPFAENLYRFCQEQLRLKVTTKANGIRAPEGIILRKFPSRVAIHPTSSREGKNWPREKYLSLARKLEKRGFEPLFLLSEEERKSWALPTPTFTSFAELAMLVAESGYMIGNDSGIGHLASCLGIPTVTICRNAKSAEFWRPGWAKGKVISPSTWIPNVKGLRWRDRHWKRWISVSRVLNEFLDLA